MKVESINFAGSAAVEMPRSTEKLTDARKEKENVNQEPDVSQKSPVPPEEFLKQIKGLTEDGLYSVRFENDDSSEQLVVKVIDRETDELIRQIPPEELLGLKASLEDLRGKFVDTQS